MDLVNVKILEIGQIFEIVKYILAENRLVENFKYGHLANVVITKNAKWI